MSNCLEKRVEFFLGLGYSGKKIPIPMQGRKDRLGPIEQMHYNLMKLLKIDDV